MLWKCVPGFNEEDVYEIWYTREKGEKVFGINVLYESKSQVTLEARIWGFGKQEEPALQYYSTNLFVVLGGEGLREKVDDMIKAKMEELERVANQQVCIISGAK